MTARTARLGALLYSTESAFLETTSTTSTRLAVVDDIDVSGLSFDKVNINAMKQGPHVSVVDYLRQQSGSFSFSMMLTGHDTSPTGALSATPLATLLGHVLGNLNTSADGGTVSSGASAISFDTADSTQIAGGLIRLGAKNDARGDGQWYAVNTFAGSTVTLLHAAAATPNAADVIYAGMVAHPSEGTSSETVQSLRFRIMSGNQQFLCRGCYPTALSFTGINPGELPKVTFTFAVSQWEVVNETFPDTTSVVTHVPAPVSRGMLHISAVGTTTRTLYNLRNWEFNIRLEMVPLMGQQNNYEFAAVNGVKRTRTDSTMSFVLDAPAAGTDTFGVGGLFGTDQSTNQFYQIMMSGGITAGRAWCVYAPNAKVTSPAPTQQDVDGLNRQTVSFETCSADETVTSNIKSSNFRIGLG